MPLTIFWLSIAIVLPLLLIATSAFQVGYDPAARVWMPWGVFGRRRCQRRASKVLSQLHPRIDDSDIASNLRDALWLSDKFWVRLRAISLCFGYIFISTAILSRANPLLYPATQSRVGDLMLAAVLVATASYALVVVTVIDVHRRRHPFLSLVVQTEDIYW